jgi:hypothetical protein
LVGFTASKHLPAIRVQPRAEMLHGMGPRAAIDSFFDVLASLGEIEWGASRVDLFADVQGWWPSVEERERFVCRATTRDTFEESGELTGFQFGRRKGGGLSARIYEKSSHIAKTGSDWWRDVWGLRCVSTADPEREPESSIRCRGWAVPWPVCVGVTSRLQRWLWPHLR